MRTLLLFASVAFSQALELTPDTWEDVTQGKVVFVKFFAPWCGHCKRMKPAWDALMEEYEDSEHLVVADVDCIEAGKPLCNKVGVKGFPTIKYGDPNDLQDYKGGREKQQLSEFAETLQPGCVVDTLEHCSDEQKLVIEDLLTKTSEELAEAVTAELEEVEAAQNAFKEEVEKLQAQYEELSASRDSTLKDIKERYNVALVKQIINTKTEL